MLFSRLFGRSHHQEPALAETYDYPAYTDQLKHLADTLPWMGETPFESADYRTVPRPAIADHGYVRRVLLSWLIGRPVSAIARRAGCSPRLVLRLVREVVYDYDLLSAFRRWLHIGLIAPVDSPRYHGDIGELDPWNEIDPRRIPVFCLVCHRVIGGLLDDDRRHDGERVTPEQVGYRALIPVFGPNEPGSVEEMQAHLISHFTLEDDPIPVFHSQSPSWAELTDLSNGKIKGKKANSIRSRASLRKRLTWTNDISEFTHLGLDRLKNSNAMDVLPVVNGTPISAKQALRQWKRLFNNVRDSGPESEE